MTLIRLTDAQKEVWQAIVDYVNSDGQKFCMMPDPNHIGDGLIVPRHGYGIGHSQLKALEREGLIIVPDDYNNGFRLTEVGANMIREGKKL